MNRLMRVIAKYMYITKMKGGALCSITSNLAFYILKSKVNLNVV